jgi:monoamine oxidase
VNSVPATAEVVVLGGGLAGLAAAVTLARAGADLQLLEGRDRVGGRVLTLRAPFGDGLYAEAGGEFIAGGHRVLRHFLRSYGIDLHPLPTGPRVFSFGGQSRRGRALADLGGRLREDADRIERGNLELAARILDPSRPWASPAAADLDARSLADWLDRLRLDPVVRAHQQVWTTVDYGVEAERLSLLQYARDERLLRGERDPAERARGGMDRLPAAMAASLGPRVHLGTVATGLSPEARSVTVRYARDRVAGVLEARYVVVALPATTLRSLDVSPPFHPARRQAVQHLAYSGVVKVLLQFRRRFWRDLSTDGGTLTDSSLQATYDATYGQPGPRGILTVYTAGQAAAELAAMTEEQRLGHCLEQLERIYPGCGADLESGISVVWDADPWSLGAYSYFRPGDLTRFGPLLARPEGRIHFAGEHTDPWQATMNGALASGVRAAREVLARARPARAPSMPA